MRAMLLDRPGARLRAADIPRPTAEAGQLLLRVRACGVCRTDLHICDGEVPASHFPLVLGHQIVGDVVEEPSPDPPRRVGVPWLGATDGTCRYCRSDRENLCDRAVFTGCDVDGGYAEYAVADARFCFDLPDAFDDLEVAPLLCAGLIGHRALRMTGDAERLGFYGFGSSAHILSQVARGQGRRVFAFTRPGDAAGQAFARSVGAVWAGGTDEAAPEELDAAIVFAPAGELVTLALGALAKGGVVVCAGIHMSDIPSFPYELLWGERSVRSVANLTREDGRELLALAPQVPIRTTVTTYDLDDAQAALDAVRAGTVEGSVVIVP